MLATCIANDWPTETYLQTEHPLQVHIRRTIEDLAREPIAAVGVEIGRASCRERVLRLV